MAKKHKNNLITASFHYLVKTLKDDENPKEIVEGEFTIAEFNRVVERISAEIQLDEKDERVVEAIKAGKDLPFSQHEEVEEGLHFGNFDGAYYGQQYRNNLLGVVPAHSLNLRPFNYLITRLRTGRIVIGITYHGQFGDYDGIRRCLSHILRGKHVVTSRTLKSVSQEIGNGVPVEIKLSYRKAHARPERRSLFGDSGLIQIKNVEFGEGFNEAVGDASKYVKGDIAERKKRLADLVKQGDLLELEDDDITGCSVIVRENGRKRTVYFLGDNSFATKFHLSVDVDANGVPKRDQIRSEMIRTLRDCIMPMFD